MLKNTLLLGLTLCIASFTVSLATPAVHAKVTKPPVELVPVTLVSTQVPPVDIDPLDPSFDQATADYLLTAMSDWPPARKEVPSVPYRDVAETIATVTSDPEDAVLLASLGYWEGARYAQYVDELRCNDPAWVRSPEGQRLSKWGTCDRGPTDKVGRAHSFWQIHPVEDRSSPLYAVCNQRVIDSSREDAARCALALAKNSLKETGSLAWYTGEWNGPHPKADVRLEFAKRAMKKHPPVAPGGSTP